MNDQLSATAAVTMFLICTFSMLTLTVAWALANRRPVRAHAHRTGRSAVPYWYSPTGRQDERGIKSL
jgi:hypothetical protein